MPPTSMPIINSSLCSLNVSCLLWNASAQLTQRLMMASNCSQPFQFCISNIKLISWKSTYPTRSVVSKTLPEANTSWSRSPCEGLYVRVTYKWFWSIYTHSCNLSPCVSSTCCVPQKKQYYCFQEQTNFIQLLLSSWVLSFSSSLSPLLMNIQVQASGFSPSPQCSSEVVKVPNASYWHHCVLSPRVM